jgi:hypothetical protein
LLRWLSRPIIGVHGRPSRRFNVVVN